MVDVFEDGLPETKVRPRTTGRSMQTFIDAGHAKPSDVGGGGDPPLDGLAVGQLLAEDHMYLALW